MHCQDAKELWKKYESGTITDEEQEQLEEHIETCTVCEARLDELLAKYEKQKRKLPPIYDVQVPFWKIKWKQRIQIVFLTLLSLVILYGAGLVLTLLYYSGDEENEFGSTRDVPQLAVQAMMPNVQSDGRATSVKPFFRTHSTMQLTSPIGKESTPIGEMEVDRFFSSSNIELTWKENAHKSMYFVHPDMGSEDPLEDVSNETWNTLEKLPEGTVSELAISFDKPYTVKDADWILWDTFGTSEMTPLTTWYALHTGYEKEEELPYLSNFQLIGFPRYLNGTEMEVQNEKLLEEQVETMMKTLADHKDVLHDLPWYSDKPPYFSQRYEYIKKNGVEIYGVVVTGPTKELLKLKDSPHIRFASLGRVELWNWTSEQHS